MTMRTNMDTSLHRIIAISFLFGALSVATYRVAVYDDGAMYDAVTRDIRYSLFLTGTKEYHRRHVSELPTVCADGDMAVRLVGGAGHFEDRLVCSNNSWWGVAAYKPTVDNGKTDAWCGKDVK